MRITKAMKEQIRREAMELAAKVRETGIPPIAYIVDENELTVKIMCPYCRQTHIHGKGGGDPEGSVVPHCWELNGMPDYVIKWPEKKSKTL